MEAASETSSVICAFVLKLNLQLVLVYFSVFSCVAV